MIRAAALAVAALTAAGCGGSGGGGGGGALGWADDPGLFTVDGLPSDRVVVGTVKNVSLRDALELDAREVEIRDASGRPVKGATVQFTAAYAHGLYGAQQRPAELPDSERRRLGLRVRIAAGRTAPLVVAYRIPATVTMPLRLVAGKASLELPARLTPR